MESEIGLASLHDEVLTNEEQKPRLSNWLNESPRSESITCKLWHCADPSALTEAERKEPRDRSFDITGQKSIDSSDTDILAESRVFPPDGSHLTEGFSQEIVSESNHPNSPTPILLRSLGGFIECWQLQGDTTATSYGRATNGNEAYSPIIGKYDAGNDDESILSLVESVFSRKTGAFSDMTALTTVSHNITKIFVDLLLERTKFKSLVEELYTKIPSDRADRNLGRLFKKYSAYLREQARVGLEVQTAKWARSHFRDIARLTRECILPSTHIHDDSRMEATLKGFPGDGTSRYKVQRLADVSVNGAIQRESGDDFEQGFDSGDIEDAESSGIGSDLDEPGPAQPPVSLDLVENFLFEGTAFSRLVDELESFCGRERTEPKSLGPSTVLSMLKGNPPDSKTRAKYLNSKSGFRCTQCRISHKGCSWNGLPPDPNNPPVGDCDLCKKRKSQAYTCVPLHYGQDANYQGLQPSDYRVRQLRKLKLQKRLNGLPFSLPNASQKVTTGSPNLQSSALPNLGPQLPLGCSNKPDNQSSVGYRGAQLDSHSDSFSRPRPPPNRSPNTKPEQRSLDKAYSPQGFAEKPTKSKETEISTRPESSIRTNEHNKINGDHVFQQRLLSLSMVSTEESENDLTESECDSITGLPNSLKNAVDDNINRFSNDFGLKLTQLAVARSHARGSENQPTSSGDGGSISSTSKSLKQSLGKRKSNSDGGGQGGSGGTGDDNERQDDKYPPKKSKVSPDAKCLEYACPYFKKDPLNHEKCASFKALTLSVLKGHLKRVHIRPIKCPLCPERRGDNGQIKDHFEACHQNKILNKAEILPDPDPILKSLLARLNRAKTWKCVFLAIYPDWVGDTPSPYLDIQDLLKTAAGRQLLMLFQHEWVQIAKCLTDLLKPPPEQSLSDAVDVLLSKLEASVRYVGASPDIKAAGDSEQISILPGEICSLFLRPFDREGNGISTPAPFDVENNQRIRVGSPASAVSGQLSSSGSWISVAKPLKNSESSASSSHAEQAVVTLHIRSAPELGIRCTRNKKLTEMNDRNWETLKEFLFIHYKPLMESGDFQGFEYNSPDDGPITIENAFDLDGAITSFKNAGEGTVMKLKFISANLSSQANNTIDVSHIQSKPHLPISLAEINMGQSAGPYHGLKAVGDGPQADEPDPFLIANSMATELDYLPNSNPLLTETDPFANLSSLNSTPDSLDTTDLFNIDPGHFFTSLHSGLPHIPQAFSGIWPTGQPPDPTFSTQLGLHLASQAQAGSSNWQTATFLKPQGTHQAEGASTGEIHLDKDCENLMSQLYDP